ncbi:MAG: hypothetical protein K1X56_03840 [Flavobacteriales bacterium]|nr:hypothetical protein [Flavobacteriales bacterium]
MNIYRFRVVLDTKDDVFCDVDIDTQASFEDLYNTIVKTFKFGGGVMSSFYLSNENWDKGEEITLLDMGEGDQKMLTMQGCKLADYMTEPRQRLILVYDFMRMWCFLVELIGEDSAEKGVKYPDVPMMFGNPPKEESKQMEDTMFGGDEMSGTGRMVDEEFGIDEDDDFGEGEEGMDDEIGGMFNDFGYDD